MDVNRPPAVSGMLSINAYHLIQNGVPITIEIPKEGAVVGIGALGINKGTKKLDAAQEFINVALDPIVQRDICNFHKCSPMNKDAQIDPELAKLPGIFTTPEQWSTQAIVTPDEVQAKLLPTWKVWFTENMSYDGNALVTRPLADETRPSQVVLARRAHTKLGAGAEVFAAECRGLFGVAN